MCFSHPWEMHQLALGDRKARGMGWPPFYLSSLRCCTQTALLLPFLVNKSSWDVMLESTVTQEAD